MPLVPRTISMRIVATGIALLLLASLGTAAWFALPRWCPGLVIRYSPWVEPVLSAWAHDRFASRKRGMGFNEFEQRIARWGKGVLPYLIQVLFTHPDAKMRYACVTAIDVLSGVAADREIDRTVVLIDVLSGLPVLRDELDWTVVRATLVAMADPASQVGEEATWMLSNWLEYAGAVVAFREIFASLTPAQQGVLKDRLPEPPSDFMRNPELVRTYVDFLTNPDPAAFYRAATALRGMSITTVFPADPRLHTWLFAYDQTGKPGTGLNDILRCQGDQSDVSGIITWLGRYAGMPVEQMHLAYACAILRNPATVPALSATLTATDPDVRIHVLQALRDIGDARALDVVIPLLADADESVRCMAVWTIGRLRDQRVPDLLKRALEDPDPLVALAAERSLAEFLPPAVAPGN